MSAEPSKRQIDAAYRRLYMAQKRLEANENAPTRKQVEWACKEVGEAYGFLKRALRP